MTFDPTIAAIRFGEGLSPELGKPQSVGAMLQLLNEDDVVTRSFPIPTFSSIRPEMYEVARHQRAYRKGRDGANADQLQRELKRARRLFNGRLMQSFPATLSRSIVSPDGFRERLVRFWADHFTVVGKTSLTRLAVPSYIEEAIRPQLTGHFEDLLISAVTHPMMLAYLDQVNSVGPNSKVGQRGDRGLNENLARELLELHTLGVDAVYSQVDVRELAELLTGLSFRLNKGPVFRQDFAEPGVEVILGEEFGADLREREPIHEALRFLARREETANHIARKLAVHFTSDEPDAALVSDLASVFRETRGHLPSIYQALLEHPASWRSYGSKVKPPFDYVVSSLRALSLRSATLHQLKRKKLQALFLSPLASMGQPWSQSPGPDGWPESGAAWITPQGLAARLQWAMSAPSAIFRGLPDPRVFLETTLGPQVTTALSFAAKAAESRREGVGLILASNAFQRR